MISLEQLVPKDHIIRKVAKNIDFEFIRDEVAYLYCHDNGLPAVDPVRLFKIMLLGYLFDIKSECLLVKEIETNVAYLCFWGMSLTEKVMKYFLAACAFLFDLQLKLCSFGTFAKKLGKMTACISGARAAIQPPYNKLRRMIRRF